jgi:hypothetical protein
MTTNEDACDDERRERLRRFLRENVPDVADFYDAGRALIAQAAFPARTTLLANVVREIRRRLVNAFCPDETKSYQPQRDLRPIAEDWPPIRSVVEAFNDIDDAAATVEVPIHVARALDTVVRRTLAVADTLRQRFLQMCAIATGEAIDWPGNERLAEEWLAIEVEGRVHGEFSGSDVASYLIEAFEQQEAIMTRIADYGQTRQARLLDLARTATPEAIRQALTEIVTLMDAHAFYGALSDPALFDALNEHGAFRAPIVPFPPAWPQAIYLQTIATARPADVLSVIRQLPEMPWPITNRLLGVALALPDDALAMLADKARWFACIEPSQAHVEPFFTIIRRLVDAGHEELALRRAGRFLSLEIEPPIGDHPFLHARAVATVGRHHFGHVLKRFVECTARARRELVLDKLSDVLDAAFRIEGTNNEAMRALWYEEMLVHSPSYTDTKRLLLDAFLSVIDALAADDLPRALTFLSSRRNNLSMFIRVRVALIRKHGSAEEVLAVFRDESLWRFRDKEFHRLLSDRYHELDTSTRAEIAASGYAVHESVIRTLYRGHDLEETRLREISRETFVQRFGESVDSLPEMYAGWSAPVATESKPGIDYDAMLIATPAEVIEIMREVELVPTETFGFGNRVRQAVKNQGEAWMASPELVRHVPVRYLGVVLYGLLEHANHAEAHFHDRLVLCRLALDLVRSQPPDADAVALTNVTQVSAQLVVALANHAMAQDEIDQAVAEIHSLLQCPGLTPPVSDSRPWSAPNSALNDPRALAVEAANELLLRAHQTSIDCAPIVSLYDELSLNTDIPVRGALGRFFTNFAAVDGESVAGWAARIFLSGAVHADRAAWAGYVLFSNVNRRVYEALRPAYQLRLRELTSAPGDDDEDGDPTERDSSDRVGARVRTAHHVWILIANGVESLDDPQSLATDLLDTGDAELFKTLVNDLVPSLATNDTDFAQQERAMLMQFWEAIVQRYESGTLHERVLVAIPALVGANVLPAGWRFAQADYLATHYPAGAIADWTLIEHLRSLAAIDRPRSLSTILRFARTGDGAMFAAISVYAGPLLCSAVANGSAAEVDLANRIASVLVTNGYRNLLDDHSEDNASL